MIGIEIFSGPGGMSLGASLAGVDVKIAVEKDAHAAETYARNHKSTTVVVEDIKNISEFIFERGQEKLVLFGGPPCQGYSNSNQKTRSRANPKNWLFEEFIRCTSLLMPDWVVIENVKGLVNLEKGFYLEKICKRLNKLGYTVNFKVLNAADFGVPQRRERVFIVGSKHGIAFDFPLATHSNPISVADAIFDLPKLSNGDMIDSSKYKSLPSAYGKMMRSNKKTVSHNYVTKNSELVIRRYEFIPQGGNWKDIPAELMSNYKDYTRCHHGIYRRLNANEPSAVIGNFRKNMLIHPTEDRGLSVREAARLQSFPDSYTFCGPLISQQQQVGDAVPPILAFNIFKGIVSVN